MASTAGDGSLSTMNARPSTRTLEVVGVGHVVATVRQRPVVSRADDEVLAPLTTVGTGDAEVRDPAEPHVVDRAQDPRGGSERRYVDDHRAVREIDEAQEVDRVAVGGQEHRRRVHEVREQEDVVVLHADRPEALPDRRHGRAREGADEGLDAVHEVEVVVEQGSRRRRRCAVVELEHAKPAVHLVRVEIDASTSLETPPGPPFIVPPTDWCRGRLSPLAEHPRTTLLGRARLVFTQSA